MSVRLVCQPMGVRNYTVQQGEIERQFRVRLPEGYDPGKRHPLAVVFHGWGAVGWIS